MAETERFQEARKAMNKRRSMSLFINNEELGQQPANPQEYRWNTEEVPWTPMTGAWLDRAIALETAIPVPEDEHLENRGRRKPGSTLPDNTIAYVALSGTTDLDVWGDNLREYPLSDLYTSQEQVDELNGYIRQMAGDLGLENPSELRLRSDTDELLNAAVWFADRLTGINMDRDLLQHLTGDLLLGITSSRGILDATLSLKYQEDAAEDITDHMGKWADFEEEEIELEGDREAATLRLHNDFWEPTYLVADENLTVGLTADAVENLVEARGRLKDDPTHRRAMRYAQEHWRAFTYLNPQEISKTWLAGEHLGLPKPQSRAIREIISPLTVQIYTQGNLLRSKSVLTLLPEQERAPPAGPGLFLRARTGCLASEH